MAMARHGAAFLGAVPAAAACPAFAAGGGAHATAQPGAAAAGVQESQETFLASEPLFIVFWALKAA